MTVRDIDRQRQRKKDRKGKTRYNSTRPTQPSTDSGTENEYRPKCGDALRLGSKGRYDSYHLWINVLVADTRNSSGDVGVGNYSLKWGHCLLLF